MFFKSPNSSKCFLWYIKNTINAKIKSRVTTIKTLGLRVSKPKKSFILFCFFNFILCPVFNGLCEIKTF